jgi:hypothetical protein
MSGASVPRATTAATPPRPKVLVPARNRSFKPRVSPVEEMSEETTTEQLTMFLLNFALIVVGIGLWMAMPGGAIFYVLVIAPAVIAIYVSLDRQIQPDNWESQGRFAARFISVLAKTALILALLMAATGIAFFVFCWVVFSNAMSGQYGRVSARDHVFLRTIARRLPCDPRRTG